MSNQYLQGEGKSGRGIEDKHGGDPLSLDWATAMAAGAEVTCHNEWRCTLEEL